MYCTDLGPVAGGGGRSRGATAPGWSSYVCTVQILALLLVVGGGAGVPHPLAGPLKQNGKTCSLGRESSKVSVYFKVQFRFFI